jgi:trimethylamine:corrinoid methyltransferase-like protein
VAAARVEQILAGHEVPALPPAVQAALAAIVAKAEARVRPA